MQAHINEKMKAFMNLFVTLRQNDSSVEKKW